MVILTYKSKENPSEIKSFRGFLVDKVIEMSNLVLVKDIIEVHAAFTSWKDYSHLAMPQ